MTQDLGRVPTELELAACLEEPIGHVREAMVAGAGYTTVPLSQPVGDGLTEFGDLLGEVDDTWTGWRFTSRSPRIGGSARAPGGRSHGSHGRNGLRSGAGPHGAGWRRMGGAAWGKSGSRRETG